MLLAKADVAKRLTKKYKGENASLLEKTKRGTWKLQISAEENYIEKLLINCLVIRRLAVKKIGLRLKIPSDSGILYPF